MNKPPVLTLGADPVASHVAGSKGHGISMMRGLGLPVPPAFCITSEGVAMLHRNWTAVTDAVGRLEAETSRRFGGGRRPLLLAVRSSGTTSMPGMLTSILNVGITDTVHAELTRLHGSTVSNDLRQRLQRHLPQADHENPYDQLRLAIESVAMSWNSARAIAYRARHEMGETADAAVIVQSMVLGNLDDRSGAGVLFTRHPVTGASTPFGEWLTAAQGEDVVSGTTQCDDLGSLRQQLPGIYDELVAAGSRLERATGDMQDVEFTVESGRLWLLQTRAAKRSAQAAARIALALYDDGILGVEELAQHVTPAVLKALTWSFLQPEARATATVLARGAPACAGIAQGQACTTGDEVLEVASSGRKAILVSRSTSPDDVPAMFAAAGLVTEVGGPTSHAAVVSREIGLPSVVGCGVGTAALLAGRTVTVDAGAGEVYAGAQPIVTQSVHDDPELRRLRDILATAEADDGALGALSAGDSELSVLQTVRLKGSITHADVAERGAPSEILVRLIDAGLLIDATTIRLSPAGRIRLGELLAEERQNLDADVLNSRYDDFTELNSAFKALISQWQMTRGEPDAVLAGLEPIHRQVLSIVSDVSRLIPRIADYARRLDAALRKAKAGEMTWLTRPLVDSYHTVWFELHEELLGVTGRTRDADS